jgi:hypothetical protein
MAGIRRSCANDKSCEMVPDQDVTNNRGIDLHHSRSRRVEARGFPQPHLAIGVNAAARPSGVAQTMTRQKQPAPGAGYSSRERPCWGLWQPSLVPNTASMLIDTQKHVGGLPQRAHGILSQNPETFCFQTAAKSIIVYYTQKDC